MERILFRADWDKSAERMIVKFEGGGETCIERMTRDRWRDYIDHMDDPARPFEVAGYKLTALGEGSRQAVGAIKSYFYMVDMIFRTSGHTDDLKEDSEITVVAGLDKSQDDLVIVKYPPGKQDVALRVLRALSGIEFDGGIVLKVE